MPGSGSVGSKVSASPSRAKSAETSAGASFYPWTTEHAPALAPDARLIRLVTSFATTAEEVDRFIAVVRAC